MSLASWGLFAGGLILLIAGAEALVRGAARLAAAFGVSPLVIGLTVVAFGTSSPELAVSLQSAWVGQGALAVGNAVGSNIFNVLFILGLSAALVPLVVAQQLVRWDVPILIAASLLLWGFALDGRLGRLEGLALFAGLVIYTVWLIRLSRRQSRVGKAKPEGEPGGRRRWWLDLVLVAAGLAMLVAGSRWLIAGAIDAARALEVSELVIGLTLVASGTSLPEVATSVLAAVRGERDIAVGNVVGSNLFNLLSVLGLPALLTPEGVAVPAAALRFDIPVMAAVSLACLPIFFTGYRVARWEGFLFLGYYTAYVVWLILAATRHAASKPFGTAMLVFVLPLTAVTLGVLAWRALRARRGEVAP